MVFECKGSEIRRICACAGAHIIAALMTLPGLRYFLQFMPPLVDVVATAAALPNMTRVSVNTDGRCAPGRVGHDTRRRRRPRACGGGASESSTPCVSMQAVACAALAGEENKQRIPKRRRRKDMGDTVLAPKIHESCSLERSVYASKFGVSATVEPKLRPIDTAHAKTG